MTVLSGFPIITTRDLPAAIAFYESAFDAVVEYRFAQDGMDAYVSLSVGGATLGVGADPQSPDALQTGDRMALWLYVDDADAAFAAALAAGAQALSEPADMPWGERVARVRAPDGTLINLGAAAPA